MFTLFGMLAQLVASWIGTPSVYLAARPQPATIFSSTGKDERKFIGRKGSALNGIGIISTSGPLILYKPDENKTGRGTAFLISPCLILANFHAVFGDDISGQYLSEHSDKVQNFKSTFSVGEPDTGTGFKYNDISATPVAWGGGEMNGTGTGAYWAKEDWAILKLDPTRCVGNDPEIGWLNLLPISDTATLATTPVISAGYPGDLDPLGGKLRLVVTQPCLLGTITDVDLRDNTSSDCTSVHGSSGSPLLAMRDGQYGVVAIDVGGRDAKSIQRKMTLENANIALLTSKIIEQVALTYPKTDLLAVIKRDIDRHKSPRIDTTTNG